MTDLPDTPHEQPQIEALLDIIPEPAVCIDPAWTITHLNAAAHELWDGALAVGLNLSNHPLTQYLYTSTGGPFTLTDSPLARTLQHGETQQNLEFTIAVPGQEDRQIRLGSTPLLRGGAVQGAVVVVQPLTTYHDLRVEAQEHSRTLQRLNDLAVRLGRLNTAPDIYQAALEGLLIILGSGKGGVMRADDSEQVFHLVAYHGQTAETVEQTRRVPYTQAPAMNQARATHNLVVIHSSTAGAVGRGALHREQQETAIVIPVVQGDQVSVCLTYLLAEYRDLSDGEREVVRTAAAHVAAALDRAALYERVEAERARLARILETMPVGVFIAEGEPAQRTIRWNFINPVGQRQVAAPRITPGVTSETFTVQHLDGRPFEEAELPIQHHLWTGQRAAEREFMLRYHTGEKRIFSASTSLLHEENGTREIIEILQDITERKRLEEQVRRQAETIRAEYERLATVIANVDISLALLDATGHILLVNDTWLKRRGEQREHVLGRRYEELVDNPVVVGTQPAVDQVLATGEPVRMRDFPLSEAESGHELYVDMSILPLRDAEGAITGAINISVDVTEQVQARQQLEAQRGLLETMVAAAPVGIAFFDRDMRVVTLNAEWARLVGVEYSAIRGQILYEALPNMGERRDAHQRALSGEAVDLDDVIYYLPGEDEPRHYEVHFRPIWDKDGAIAGILVAANDITQRHEIDQQKDEFIALASHELKTPVTAIKGYAQSGLRAAVKLEDERLMRTLRVIDEQSNRLTRLINELLDVSRTQNNTLSLYAEPFDLRRLADEVVHNLQLTAPDFALDLQLPTVPTPVNADRQRIEQVLVNLVQNAIKYSGPSERVEVSIAVEGDEVITRVRDFGVGIPLDQQAQVFDRFFRARNVSSRHYSGLGLGLFIARGIIERHGGRIWLQSVEGEGSTFAFALPRLHDE